MSTLQITDFLTSAQIADVTAGTFTLDTAPAINAAVASLPSRGGDVSFIPGGYRLDSPVSLGDGTASSVSTRNGMRLVGEGRGYGFDGLLAPFSPVLFKLFSTNGEAAVNIKGPLHGWGIDNIGITFDSSALLATALYVMAASFGEVNGLQIVGPNNYGIIETSRGGGASAHNKWDNVFIHLPATAPNATGLLITGDNTTLNGAYFDSWRNLFIQPSNAGHTGINLQYADSVSFWNTRINKTGAAPAHGIMFNYAVKAGFPNDNTFFALDPFNNKIENTGSAPGGTIYRNEIHGLLRGNGAAVPSLANLVVK